MLGSGSGGSSRAQTKDLATAPGQGGAVCCPPHGTWVGKRHAGQWGNSRGEG